MRNLVCCVLFALACVFAGCTNSAKKEFNALLIELAEQDKTIDSGDWAQIVTFLDNNKANFKEFYKDGQMDVQEVQEYISDFFEHRRPPFEVTIIGQGHDKLTFRLFIERSGSMTPYDSKDGDGSFRSTIMSLQNSLPGDVKMDSIGEKGYTDFRKIFDKVLNKTNKDEVSILVTDMIYSVRDMANVNPQKVFNEAEEMISAVFKDEVKNKSMVAIRMIGSYNGPYYAYDNSAHQFAGKRPYYILVVGSNENIKRLTQDPSLRFFSEIQGMRGYDNMCLFTAEDLYEPYHSFLLTNHDVRGRFKPAHGQGYQIKSLEDVKPDKNSGDVQLVLAVDLSDMLIDQRYLCDKGNYMVEADDDIKLKAIRKIEKADMTPAQKQYIGTATHIFILSANRINHEQDVEIKLLNRMPEWIENCTTENDLTPDSRSTFALKYILGGIWNSYKRYTDRRPCFFELELKLDK